MPGGSGIHRPGDRSRQGIASCSGIHTPEDRGMRGHPSSLGMRSRENRSKRGIPNSPHIHSPAASSPDIRKQEVRRLGSRNRCRVAAEVCSQLPRIFRLPLRSLLRERLPARHLRLLQWQHQKPLPECPRQGRVEQDHKGLYMPRGPTPPRQSNMGQFGSSSLLRPSTGLNRQPQRIERALSLEEASASALRARRAYSGRSRKLAGRACAWRSH
jgi:hypothetical protein